MAAQPNMGSSTKDLTNSLDLKQVLWDIKIWENESQFYFEGKQLRQNCFAFLLKQGAILKGKNLLQKGSEFFQLKQTPFQKGFGVQNSKQ